MDWSSHVTYGKYLRASARALRPLTILIFGVVAVGLGLLAGRGTSLLTQVVIVVVYLAVFAAIMAAVMAYFLRQTFRASGSRQMRYRLDAQTLSLMMGDDKLDVPRAKLQLTRSGSDFVAVRRVGKGFGSTLLFFDDPAVASRVADQLR